MSIWNGNFTIKKNLTGWGYFVVHDGITIAYTVTLWGAKRVIQRAKVAHQWNVEREDERRACGS